MLISIIIPVYNEESSIKKILLKIKKVKKLNIEINLIDDGSSDSTRVVIANECNGLYNKAIFLKKNFGKGFALRKGFALAFTEFSTGKYGWAKARTKNTSARILSAKINQCFSLRTDFFC